jgi:hypothetical protein
LLGLVWQDWQSVKPEWSKFAGFQALVLWQLEHCPLEWLLGLSLLWQD